MPFLTRDRALALLTLLLVGVLGWEARNLPGPTRWQNYGSDFFPKLLLAVLGVLAVILLLRSFLPAARAQAPVLRDAADFLRHNPRIVAVIALFGAYAWLLPVLGFRVATIGYLVLSIGLLTGLRTWRAALLAGVVAVAATLLVYAVFQYGLRLRLP